MKTISTTHYESTQFGDMQTGRTVSHVSCDNCEKLEQQLKEANEVIMVLNKEAVGREYGLDAECIWEISKIYIEKYGVEI